MRTRTVVPMVLTLAVVVGAGGLRLRGRARRGSRVDHHLPRTRPAGTLPRRPRLSSRPTPPAPMYGRCSTHRRPFRTPHVLQGLAQRLARRSAHRDLDQRLRHRPDHGRGAGGPRRRRRPGARLQHQAADRDRGGQRARPRRHHHDRGHVQRRARRSRRSSPAETCCWPPMRATARDAVGFAGLGDLADQVAGALDDTRRHERDAGVRHVGLPRSRLSHRVARVRAEQRLRRARDGTGGQRGQEDRRRIRTKRWPDPAASAADVFAARLDERGITVTAVAAQYRHPRRASGRRSTSAPLSAVVEYMLHESDNTIAEVLTRVLAIHDGRRAVPADAMVSVRAGSGRALGST